MKRFFAPFALILVFVFHQICMSAPRTFYVATSGSDNSAGTSSAPFATFNKAFSSMTGGDTLIIKDGTYNQEIRNYYGEGFPSGTADKYTVIRAENDWKVTATCGRIDPAGSAQYFVIRGIHFNGGGGGNCRYAKFIRCSFRGDKCDDNTSVAGASSGSSYVLFEECFAYGCGRYKFLIYGDQDVATEKIIFRRCISRHDYHDPDPGWGRQCATYTSYDGHDVLWQNCISINSGDINPALYGNLYGAIWFENKETTPEDNSATVRGCVFLDLGGWGFNDPKCNGTRIIENSVVWDATGGYGGGNLSGNRSPTLTLDHLTIGTISGNGYEGAGMRFESPFASAQAKNSLLTGCEVAVYNYQNFTVAMDYNNYYSNTSDFSCEYGRTPFTYGTHDKQVNPELKYLCRIENDSPLKGAASDGGDIGATILKQYGLSGTLWGEAGYDSLTDIALWPFPNEDVIKTTMASWTGQNNAKRGFCADGNGLYGGPITLTSYIWEYLGNPCPPEIYDGATARDDLPEQKNQIHGPCNLSVVFMPQQSIIDITYTVEPAISGLVAIAIYNAAGRCIGTIRGLPQTPGEHTVTWNKAGKNQGVFFIRLQTGKKAVTRRVVL